MVPGLHCGELVNFFFVVVIPPAAYELWQITSARADLPASRFLNQNFDFSFSMVTPRVYKILYCIGFLGGYMHSVDT